MSWSIEEHIGECRPFPAQVVVYKGETDECLAYVSGEVADRLKAENAKLRELVCAAWRCIHTGPSCYDCCLIAGGCTLQSAMRELGVEL